MGGHYKHDLDGPDRPPNELWPGFETDRLGRARTSASADWVAGPRAASVVVHDPGEDGEKAICADL